MATKGTVLVTGVNGYISAQVAAFYLEAGFSVRGTVRAKNASTNDILEALQEFVSDGRFDVVEVPDITVDGAFDEAVKGVTVIAHLASPVSGSFTDPEPVIRVAVQGTLTILNSAAAHAGPQLRAVVLASSVAAVVDINNPPDHVYTEADWNNFAEDMARNQGTKTPGMVIYAASKVAGERAFWRWRDENTPSFAMTAIHPAFVYGPPLYLPPVSKLSGSVLPVHTILSGQDIPVRGSTMGMSRVENAVDVRDVARIFVWAADHPEQATGERYLAVGGALNTQAIADILRREFPEKRSVVQKGNPGNGYDNDFVSTQMDASKAEKAIGQKWTSVERSVVDTARMFIENNYV